LTTAEPIEELHTQPADNDNNDDYIEGYDDELEGDLA
jgi:hypothetical protein